MTKVEEKNTKSGKVFKETEKEKQEKEEENKHLFCERSLEEK